MIATLGLAALWLAAALAALQLVGGFLTLRLPANPLAAVVRPVAAVQGGLVGLAMLCLIAVFWQTDLSVALVASNSHSAKPEETKIIQRHPEAGFKMLSGIPYLREEIQIVLGHQEKWNGTGYPYGLRGEEIPLGARLFMIADTFDALTSDRPYRMGRPYEAARQIIEEESGKQFDPQAVAAFLAVPGEEWAQIRARVMAEIEKRRNKMQEINIKLEDE